MAQAMNEEKELETQAINESIAGRKEFLDTFNKFDSNNDGYISLNEFNGSIKFLLIHHECKDVKNGYKKYGNNKGLDLESFIALIFYCYPKYHYLWQYIQSQLPPNITLEPDLTIYEIQSNLMDKKVSWKEKNKTIRVCISMNVASDIKVNVKLSILHALLNCGINKNEDNEVRRNALLAMGVFTSINRDLIKRQMDMQLFDKLVKALKTASVDRNIMAIYNITELLKTIFMYIIDDKYHTFWKKLLNEYKHKNNKYNDDVRLCIVQCLRTIVDRCIESDKAQTDDDFVGELYDRVESLKNILDKDDCDDVKDIGVEMIEMFEALEQQNNDDEATDDDDDE